MHSCRVTEQLTWYVLSHSPGPAADGWASVLEHPGIVEHYAFLRRRLEAGELVTAGPLPEVDGEGMTVLKVASLDEARRLAHEDDQAVVTGVLKVVVRSWEVVMTSIGD